MVCCSAKGDAPRTWLIGVIVAVGLSTCLLLLLSQRIERRTSLAAGEPLSSLLNPRNSTNTDFRTLAVPPEQLAPQPEAERVPVVPETAPDSSLETRERVEPREKLVLPEAALDERETRRAERSAVEEAYHLERHRAIYDLIDRGAVLGSSTDKDALELLRPSDTSHSVFVVAPVGDMLHLVELRRGEQLEFFRFADRREELKQEFRLLTAGKRPYRIRNVKIFGE